MISHTACYKKWWADNDDGRSYRRIYDGCSFLVFPAGQGTSQYFGGLCDRLSACMGVVGDVCEIEYAPELRDKSHG